VIRETRVQITATLDMRLYPGVSAVRKAIVDGLVGEPVLAFVRKSYKFRSDRPGSYKRPDVVGGTFPWIGIHALDCISYTTGLRIIRAGVLRSSKTDVALPGNEDNSGILAKLSGGGTGIVSLNYPRPEAAASHGDDRLRVTGTHGVVEMMGERVQLVTQNHSPEELPLPPHRCIVDSFVSFLRGQGQHVMTAEEAFRITRVCVTARRAAEAQIPEVKRLS